MPVAIRPATSKDQPTITRLIREARLNPRHLRWRNFHVAEIDGAIVGVRQVKQHAGGTREVASGYVVPAFRRQGISRELLEAAIARESGDLFLMCDQVWCAYYAESGFRIVSSGDLPPDFRREFRIGRVVTGVLTVFRQHRVRLAAMCRSASTTNSPL